MNILTDTRKTFESGKLSKIDFIELIHAQHTLLFNYIEYLSDTDVESIHIMLDGIYVRSRSQKIDLLLNRWDQHLVPYTLMNFRHYERSETEFLKSICKPNWTVLDIGANCGWYALSLAKHNISTQIYAFEPIPETYNILLSNITLNCLPNIHPRKLGFSNCEQTLNFLYTPKCSGATSLTHAGQPVAHESLQSISCNTSTIDLFCSQNNIAPNLIKCDVEGSELLVLQGAEKTIANHKPVVLIELLRKWSRKFGYEPNDVISLFCRHGYQAYTLTDRTLHRCFSIDENTIETNFLFLHPLLHFDILNQSIGN